jgi:isoquinoline 1-oxidoreductase beta subunit
MGSFDRILAAGGAVNLSRRGALGAAGALLLGFGLPRGGRAQAPSAPTPPALPPASRHAGQVAAYLEIRRDGTIRLMNPFVEGGQGIDTAAAQLVAEELDADPAAFVVEQPPVAPEYNLVFDQLRITGGSLSVRSAHTSFRRVGATARAMLVQAAAAQWGVPAAELSTEPPGRVLHRASGRAATYGELAEAAARLAPPAEVALKPASEYRVIGKPVKRLDSLSKSTGQARYGIDTRVDGMLHAAVLHSTRRNAKPTAVANEVELRGMPGVHSVHLLPEGVAVLADSWWRARRAADAAQVTWEGGVAAGFSSAGQLAAMKAAAANAGTAAERHGDAEAAFRGAARVVEAEYDAPYLAHAQMEPPSAIARFNGDGTLDLWVPNQAPDLYRATAAGIAGMTPDKVRVHSPPLGGFFGRHFLYGDADPFREAIALARAVGRPVRVLWSREEEFKRDAYRPLSYVRLRGALDASGNPVGFQAKVVGEGPIGRHFPGFLQNPAVDSSAVEGITEKHYGIPNRAVDWVKLDHPVNIGFWRSVGHSMNDFFYESFLDEMAAAGGKDPFELRLALLRGNARLTTLLNAAAELSGGWRRGPYDAPDGTRRARGVAMASPFGSEVATIAEVSVNGGEVVVHDIWVAIDPGSIVNPAIIAQQVRSAATIGLSSALLEEMVFEGGEPRAVNYDGYQILNLERMPRVHVRIVESGAPIGGIGEPGTPGIPPAVANAVAALTGQRIRSLPFAKTRIGAA